MSEYETDQERKHQGRRESDVFEFVTLSVELGIYGIDNLGYGVVPNGPQNKGKYNIHDHHEDNHVQKRLGRNHFFFEDRTERGGFCLFVRKNYFFFANNVFPFLYFIY
jgi:hypothetical protein